MGYASQWTVTTLSKRKGIEKQRLGWEQTCGWAMPDAFLRRAYGTAGRCKELFRKNSKDKPRLEI